MSVKYEVRKNTSEPTDMSLGDLMKAKFARVRRKRPKDWKLYCAEWYCDNSDCPIREVTIDVKLARRETLTLLSCPCCGHFLKFHCYLEEEVLVPVGNKSLVTTSVANNQEKP